jgi:hypothetical protein
MSAEQINKSGRQLCTECENTLFHSEVLIGRAVYSLTRSRELLARCLVNSFPMGDAARLDVTEPASALYETRYPVEIQSDVEDLLHCSKGLLSDNCDVRTLTLEEQLVIDAVTQRLKDKFALKPFP